MNLYTLIVICYFLFIIIISFTTKKIASRSASDFLIAGRNLGVIVCAIVVAAEWLGGMSTIGVSEKAFTTGTLQPILYNIATSVGMIIIGFTVASHYREKNVHTVSEMLKHLFGKNVRQISAIAFLIAYITLAYVQLQTCASIISPLFNITWIQAVLISSLIITLYTYIGGMHAIVLVGIIHVFVMFTGIGTAMIIGISKAGGFTELLSRLIEQGAPANAYNPFSAGWNYAFSLLLGGVLGGMAGQASIQPIFAAKDVKTAKRAAIASSLIIAPFGIMVGILGLIARSGQYFEPSTISNPKLVLPLLLTNPEFVPPVIGGIAISGILAAILSTVGPVNFAVVTIAAKDIYQGLINPKADDKSILKISRLLVISVGLITIPLAIFLEGSILDAAYVSYAIRAIGAIVIVVGIYARGWISPLSVKLSFIGGTIAVFVSIILYHLDVIKIDKTYVAVVSAIVFIIIGQLISKRNGKKIE